MAELNASVRVAQVGDAVAVRHVDGRIQKLGNAVQRCLAAEVFSISIEMAMMGQTMASK